MPSNESRMPSSSESTSQGSARHRHRCRAAWPNRRRRRDSRRLPERVGVEASSIRRCRSLPVVSCRRAIGQRVAVASRFWSRRRRPLRARPADAVAIAVAVQVVRRAVTIGVDRVQRIGARFVTVGDAVVVAVDIVALSPLDDVGNAVAIGVGRAGGIRPTSAVADAVAVGVGLSRSVPSASSCALVRPSPSLSAPGRRAVRVRHAGLRWRIVLVGHAVAVVSVADDSSTFGVIAIAVACRPLPRRRSRRRRRCRIAATRAERVFLRVGQAVAVGRAPGRPRCSRSARRR